MDAPTPPTDAPLPGSLLTRIVDEMLTSLATHPDVPAPLLTALQSNSDEPLLTSPDALREAILSATKAPAR